MSNNGVLQAFKAEALLADQDVLTRIENLRKNLQYSTTGEQVSFNDYLTILREAVDAIPKLELEIDVAPGAENHYSIQLVTSMERIVDDCDRILRRLAHFQGRLRDAERQIDNLKSEFIAWYLLAAGTLMSELEETLPVKLPARELRMLADAEFSRLMQNIDLRVLSLLEDLKLEFERVTQHKSTQKEKHNLGKDQANASWTSTLPAYGSSIPENERTDKLAHEPELEEEESGVPKFISRKPQIADIRDTEIKGTFRKPIVSLTPAVPVKDEQGKPVTVSQRQLLIDEDEDVL